MIRISKLALLLAFLAGCSAPVVKKAIPAGQVRTVGWYVEIDGRVHNVHTGITILGNFDDPLENNWGLAAHLQAQLEQRQKRAEIDLAWLRTELEATLGYSAESALAVSGLVADTMAFCPQ